jgi:hypothetical protein
LGICITTSGRNGNIQQVRITREQARQKAIETQRKQIEFDLWYETVVTGWVFRHVGSFAARRAGSNEKGLIEQEAPRRFSPWSGEGESP